MLGWAAYCQTSQSLKPVICEGHALTQTHYSAVRGPIVHASII